MLPIQALCTEASLHALQRHYPQIYDSDEKLLIDPASVSVTKRDFLSAFSAMTPASHRSAAAPARHLASLSFIDSPWDLHCIRTAVALHAYIHLGGCNSSELHI